MKILFWLLLAGLIVLHQDYWQWDDATLVFGFLPWGLFYHACLSLVIAAFWLLAVTVWWPADEEPPASPEAASGKEDAE